MPYRERLTKRQNAAVANTNAARTNANVAHEKLESLKRSINMVN